MFQDRPFPPQISNKKYAQTIVTLVDAYRAEHFLFSDQQLTHKQVDQILHKAKHTIYQLEELK